MKPVQTYRAVKQIFKTVTKYKNKNFVIPLFSLEKKLEQSGARESSRRKFLSAEQASPMNYSDPSGFIRANAPWHRSGQLIGIREQTYRRPVRRAQGPRVVAQRYT